MIDALILKNLIDNLPCSSAYKDVNSIFTYANAEYAKIVELKHPFDVIGRTAYDMPARSSECAALVHEQDNKVIKSRKPLSLLGIHPDAQGKFKAYKFRKTPLQNQRGDIDGILVTGEDVTSEATFKLGSFLQKIPIATNGKLLLDNGTYLIGTDHIGVDISKREHEVLFYSLRVKRTKIIANLLDITPRTVFKHMTALREKFEVSTTAELRDKATEMGLIHVLPQGIFDPKLVASLNVE
ncbi:PAS domain-containing protein [Burkholderia sp. L27(2015)]|uniref:helix-turn-helix transcriptional regulator n=1 Tax=Burkholderia sp. L27(2015) TaxID=1641858 RepID=UPI00131E2478|nr:helix-turn-helix transcriptional regulator [Burkholderia sp. L27(2015)]